MSDGKKYIDVDDFSNMENVIKKVDPSYSDVFARMPGPVANYGQQQMALSIRADSNKDMRFAEKPYVQWLLNRSK